jgi:hypothetical protein
MMAKAFNLNKALGNDEALKTYDSSVLTKLKEDCGIE